jgi:hypothetical protein
MIEIWKDINDFEGYQISNCGNVRSCRPLNGIGRLKDTYRILKLLVDKHKGYYRIGLHKDKKITKLFVHRLVLEAFVGPCPEEMEARHLDGNPKHNCVENLEWGTRIENRHDRIRHGRNNRGEDHPMATLNVDQVKEIKKLLKENRLHEHQIGELFGVSRDVVSKIRQGKNWGWLDDVVRIEDAYGRTE